MQKRSVFEIGVEAFLWKFRLIVFIVVIALIVASLFAFYLGLHSMYEAYHAIVAGSVSGIVLVLIISALDEFLLGIVLVIFSLGIYELFISKIEQLDGDEIGQKWLKFSSIEDLKTVLTKVLIIILMVYFFKSVVVMKFDSPLSILYLGGGILLIAVAQYLSHLQKEKGKDEKGRESAR